ADVGQPEIEDQDVGAQRIAQTQRLRPVCRDSNHREVRLLLGRCLGTCAHDWVVVDDDHPGGSLGLTDRCNHRCPPHMLCTRRMCSTSIVSVIRPKISQDMLNLFLTYVTNCDEA